MEDYILITIIIIASILFTKVMISWIVEAIKEVDDLIKYLRKRKKL